MINITKRLVLSRCLWGSGENCWQVVDCTLIIQCPPQGCMLPGLGQWIILVLSSVHQFDSFTSARASLFSLSMSAGQKSQSEFGCCAWCYCGGCCCFQTFNWLKDGYAGMLYMLQAKLGVKSTSKTRRICHQTLYFTSRSKQDLKIYEYQTLSLADGQQGKGKQQQMPASSDSSGCCCQCFSNLHEGLMDAHLGKPSWLT